MFGCFLVFVFLGYFFFFNLATDKQMSNELTQEKEIYLNLNCIVKIIM